MGQGQEQAGQEPQALASPTGGALGLPSGGGPSLPAGEAGGSLSSSRTGLPATRAWPELWAVGQGWVTLGQEASTMACPHF